MKKAKFTDRKSFSEIEDFLKEKGFIPQYTDYVPEYLEERNHSYLEISEDGTLIVLVEYGEDDKLTDFGKELRNIFTEYMLLVKNDLSEFRFYKYDSGTDKILKLRKKRSDLESVFLKKIEELDYNNIETIEKLFDRSEFIEEFYKLYCDTEGYLLRKIEGITDDNDREIFAKLILQRTMFLWFLQKKKLLDNNKNYFVEKYKDTFKSRKNFYDDFLKNLYFKGLCVKSRERANEINELIGDIPYLNGGLFIPSEIEEKYGNNINIPNEVFYHEMTYPITKGERNIPVLNLLECKEWTVDERGGDVDKLNPEILGYIFEKSINKKDLGAVYTPEEITTYICKNTIHPFLLDTINEEFSKEYEEIYNIFEDGEKEEWEYLFKRLKDIKIVDPAVGSGHFLVDAIVILERIYHRLREKDIIGWSNYQIREQIIVNNLFGVDILEGAVEICKLRLFLSLAETFRTKEDVQPLPNIDFNIRCGNSLIGFISTNELEQEFFSQGDAVNALLKNIKFLEDNASEIVGKAKDILNKFSILPMDLFRLRTDLVKMYRMLHDKDLQPKTRKVLKDITDAFNRELNAQYYGQIKDVFKKKELSKLRENEKKDMFLNLGQFHWIMEYSEVFEKGGFDVVIGNPPYIENKKMKKILEKRILNKKYKSAYKLFDISVTFVERGIDILKNNCYFSYIITNKFISTDYGVKVRELLLKETLLREILDVSHIDIFKEAAAYPIIINFIKKNDYDDVIIGIQIENKMELKKNKFDRVTIAQENFLKMPNYIIDISGNFHLCEDIKNANVIRLDDVCKFFYRSFGFTNWSNILSYVVKDKTSSDKNWLKFIGTTNITPFVVDWNKSLRVSKQTFKRCYLKYNPNFPADMWDIYTQEKLSVKEVASYLTTSYDPGEYVNLTGMYTLLIKDQRFSYFYLLGILNSRILDFFFRSLYGSTHMAGGYLRFNGSYLKELPIYIPNNDEKIIIEFLSKAIYFVKNFEDDKILETDIDVIEYQLYELLNCTIYELYFKNVLGTNVLKDVEKIMLTIDNNIVSIEDLHEFHNKIEENVDISKGIERIKRFKIIKWIESNSINTQST